MADMTMEKFVSFLKNQGFVYQGSEIYGGLANAWDYGPLGVELKIILNKHGGESSSKILHIMLV